MKVVELVLRTRKRKTGRMKEGVNLTKIHCKHIRICHNVSTVKLLNADKFF
jgi:hypothetical protein